MTTPTPEQIAKLASVLYGDKFVVAKNAMDEPIVICPTAPGNFQFMFDPAFDGLYWQRSQALMVVVYINDFINGKLKQGHSKFFSFYLERLLDFNNALVNKDIPALYALIEEMEGYEYTRL